MANKRVEDRLAALETEVARLRAEVEMLKPDWRGAIGMFTGNEFMKQVNEAGRKIREADRRKAYREFDRRHKKKPRTKSK